MKDKVLYIDKVIHSIDWDKIKSYYHKLGIQWSYQNDNETISHSPSISELKEDLRSILLHMLEQDISYISYGNWIIFWDREEDNLGDIRVIFRIADFVFEEDNISESLENKLAKAIENEDYEYAAIIRDEIKKMNIS